MRQRQAAVFHEAAALANAVVLDRAVAALHRYGLIVRVPEGLRMHPLIQAVIRERIPETERDTWIEAALGFLLRYMSGASAAPDQDVLTPHAAACAEAALTAAIDPLALCMTLSWLGNRHFCFGTLKSARDYLEHAQSLAEEASLPSQAIFGCLGDLVKTYRADGNIEAALTTAAAWMMWARDSGVEPEYYKARRACAHTLVNAQRFREAADAFAALSDTPPELRTLRDQILDLSVAADLDHGCGRYDEALDAVDKALQLVSQVESEVRRQDHCAALHNQAARILRDVGRRHDALARQRQAVEAARSCGFGVLASRLLDVEMADEAEQVISEGMALAAARGTDSPLCGTFLQASGRLALLRSHWAEAENLLTKAVRLTETGGEPRRTDLAGAYFNLGVAQAAQGKLRSAVTAHQRARDLDATVYGSNHPELLVDEYSLAGALYAAGQLNSARTAISRCLAIMRQGSPQGRLWRTQVIVLTIAIDIGLGSPAA